MNLSNILRNKSLLATVALGLASASSAFSTATITVGGTTANDGSGWTSFIAGAAVTNFDNLQTPSNYTLPRGNNPLTDSLTGFFAGDTPAHDDTAFLSTAGGKVSINFAADPIKYFGLYWGDINANDTVTFTDNFGKHYSYSGSALSSLGEKTHGDQSEYVNFFADYGETWTSVALSSTSFFDPFVFDNVASSTAPEPASFVTAGLGIALAGLGVIRRRRSLARAQQ